jgi:hypothetical protein
MTETTKKVPAATSTKVSKLADIQLKLKAPKSQFNKFANFNYRSCEDILEAVKPLLGEYSLILSDNIVQFGDRYYVKSTAQLHDVNGNIVSSSEAFAREADVKTGMDAAQITGAASSYARKYALNGLFLIDDTQDADTKDNTAKDVPNAKPATTPTTPKAPVTPTTPKTPETPTNYPASVNQLAWVDKILKGRKERDQITDEQLKKLTSKVASDFIGGKIKSEELFKVLGVPFKHENAPILDEHLDALDNIDLSVEGTIK